MKRRDLLAGLLPVAVTPLAWAQQRGKMYRVAILHPSNPLLLMSEHGGLSNYQALFQVLRRLGYEEGRNLTVERYSGGGQEETFPRLVKRIVATQPDLIFVSGTSDQVIAEAAAGRVPIVAFVIDPVAAGLATSLSRPSANVTGVVADLGVVGEKRLELLREVRPGANHVAALTLHQYWDLFSGRGQRMAQEHGMRLTCLCVANPVQESAYRQAFANLGHDRPDFINVFSGAENFTYRELIVGLVNEMRVPAMYPARQFVELGGLMSYAWDSDELFRYAARQMAAILRGQPVSEIPFYMPIKWELAINLRTAKGIGLEIPPSILARADEVIE
jgi:putative ABC transport system substrate-binding protein